MITFFQNSRSRGFTLLIAVILTSVILSIGLALLDISYKQITLAATARQSQYAFYAADSGLECALFSDSADIFDYSSEPTGVSPGTPSGSFSCEGQAVSYFGAAASGGTRTTTFSIPCAGGGTSADVTVIKSSTGVTGIYSNGYNTCVVTNPRRIERGEEAHY
jgi:Tfp pilus assembly protein PilX